MDRAKLEVRLKRRSKELGVKDEFATLFKAYKKDYEQMINKSRVERALIHADVPLKYGENGAPLLTIENFSIILDNDPTFQGKFLFNELSGSPEQIINRQIERWRDEDDSKLRAYIEQKYSLFQPNKLDDALRIKFAQNKYHPIRDLIKSIEWDGQNRIETLLIKYLGVEDTPYSREVSRLIFAGGIHRAFEPGCKFDDMAVLIGRRQGEGKSTFVRWLAMEDRFYREVTEIDGQRGIESLEGAWICEMGELLALKRSKEVEAVKSYITRQVDTYRQPFDKRTTDHPRQCIFIGTTNNIEFLTDKTGNRRYYPLICNNSGRDLFDNSEQIKSDIRQCWAEAYSRMLDGEMPAVANRDLTDMIRSKQNESVEDDYRVGMIEDYLQDKDVVCILELWEQALKEPFKPSKRDSNEIALIMQNLSDWEKSENPRRFQDYGRQKAWVRTKNDKENDDFLPF